MTILLKGKPVADKLNEKTKKRVAALQEYGVTPCLATLRVGERPDEIAYEKGTSKRCADVGIEVVHTVLPEEAKQGEVEAHLERLNQDERVHGIIIFSPLPQHLDLNRVRMLLNPQKDVDGVTDGSHSKMYSGYGHGFAPCTAQSCIEMLQYHKIDLRGKHVVVIGRSLVVGKPLAQLLLRRDATVTVCHSRSRNIEQFTQSADIIVVAAGKPGLITRDHLGKDQVIIDVGINWNDATQSLCGDVDFDAVKDEVAAISPVPGGVGSITTSMLVANVVSAAYEHAKEIGVL